MTVSALAMAFSYWSIQGSGYQTVYYGLFVLLLGLPVYVWLKRDRGEYGEPEPARPAAAEARAPETPPVERTFLKQRTSRSGGQRKNPLRHHD